MLISWRQACVFISVGCGFSVGCGGEADEFTESESEPLVGSESSLHDDARQNSCCPPRHHPRPRTCRIDNGGCDPLTTCSAHRGQITCGPCPPGYTGSGEIECVPGPCAADPCQHGGACSETPEGRQCTCQPGFSGESCEVVFTELVTGEAHTCGLRTDGSVACWGLLQLGGGDAPAMSFSSIAAGLYHGCGIRNDDAGLTCWGSNQQGQANAPSGTFQDVAAGRFTTCAVSTAGALSCWGLDGFGGVLVPPGGTFASVGTGSAAGRTCAIRPDGTASCFGPSTGDGSGPPPLTFTAVASGLFESCGIASDGQIACWDFDFRQAQPPSGSFRALALGLVTACAIRVDGSLVCWGDGAPGLMDPPAGAYKAVAVGHQFACAIRSDDAVVCWGDDTDGKLTPP
jgi:hypothetical protein